MKTALLFSAVYLFFGGIQGSGTTSQTQLELPDIGLAMSYPKTWQVSPIKKTNDYKVLLPVEGSSQRAELEIYNVGFDAERDIWQLAQKGINNRMKRDIMRQWEEELLGVPLLLTKVSYTDKEGPKIQLTGLMYSRTPKKLMFKLTASPDDFDKAEYAWRETMQTFRTGMALKPEDPSKPRDTKNAQRISQPPVIVTKPKSLDAESKVVKPALTLEATAAGRKLLIRYPAGWVAKIAEDGVITFTHPEVSGKITATLASSLDSDPAARALFIASSKTLNDFQKVAKRDESVPTANKAGATSASVWRVGTSAQGDLFTCDSTVAQGDFYLVLSYRTTNGSKIGGERKAVEALLQMMTIDVAP